MTPDCTNRVTTLVDMNDYLALQAERDEAVQQRDEARKALEDECLDHRMARNVIGNTTDQLMQVKQQRDEARADYAALGRQYVQLEQEAHNDLCQCQAERDTLLALLREVLEQRPFKGLALYTRIKAALEGRDG